MRVDSIRSSASSPSSSIYTKEYFLSGACEGYDAFRQGRLSTVRQRELELLELRPPMTVLDLGCGRGDMAAELARRNVSVVAADFAVAAVELTADRLSGRAPVVIANAARLPFRDGVFDRVLIADVIEHMEWSSAAASVAECRRVISRTGFVLVHTAPNAWFSNGVLRLLRPLLRPLGWRAAIERLRQYDHLRAAMHPNELSLLSLRRLVREAGLSGRVWIERDILRGGESEWARDIRGSAFWRGLTTLAGNWPFRLVFGNDLYARVSRQ
jgi:ubiquinone/menaquinone biosynthesis C-methylase UbiE